MTTNFLAFRNELKIMDVLEIIRLRARKKVPPSSYVYVTDSENHLVGTLNMGDVALAEGDTDLQSIMRKDVFSINAFTDR